MTLARSDCTPAAERTASLAQATVYSSIAAYPLWQHQPLPPPDSTHRPVRRASNRATTLSADPGRTACLIVDGMAEANLRFAQLSSPRASRCYR